MENCYSRLTYKIGIYILNVQLRKTSHTESNSFDLCVLVLYIYEKYKVSKMQFLRENNSDENHCNILLRIRTFSARLQQQFAALKRQIIVSIQSKPTKSCVFHWIYKFKTVLFSSIFVCEISNNQHIPPNQRDRRPGENLRQSLTKGTLAGLIY